MNSPLTKFTNPKQAEDVYILVKWPFVQNLMEYTWFKKECILYNANDRQAHLDSAYFVPIVRMLEFSNDLLGM